MEYDLNLYNDLIVLFKRNCYDISLKIDDFLEIATYVENIKKDIILNNSLGPTTKNTSKHCWILKSNNAALLSSTLTRTFHVKKGLILKFNLDIHLVYQNNILKKYKR